MPSPAHGQEVFMRSGALAIAAVAVCLAAVCPAEEKPTLRATWAMPPACDPFGPVRIKDLAEELRQTGYRLVIAIHPEKGSDYAKHVYPARDLYVINADGTGLKQLTHTPDKEERAPRTSPDGRWFTYNYGDFLVNARTLETREVGGGYVWAPDSKRTVTCEKRGIVYTDMATGETSTPIRVEQRVDIADMSSDGRWFIFEIRNFRGTPYSIDFMPSTGGPIRKMPNHPVTAGECHPHFSPDGKWMCWNGGESLAVRRFDPSLPDGTDGKIVTLPKELIGQDPCGRWSHCGRYIAYVKIPHGGGWQAHSPICIVRLADNATITLSPPGWIGHHWDYDWLPPADE
jgi:Tol biopolymer transport system component